MDHRLDRVDALEHQLHTLQQQTQTATRRLRWWRGLAAGFLGLAVLTWALPVGTAQEEAAASSEKKTLEQRVAALEALLKPFSRKGNEVTIKGANLHLVNGLGSTDCMDEQGEPIPNCPNGLGNLIVGYNEVRNPNLGETIRTGSHNVVVGPEHNFSRFGGLVVGFSNNISGDFAVVSGGFLNTASGEISSVTGGVLNTASGSIASVSGGSGNNASGDSAVVSGGVGNMASGARAMVSGGSDNTASGDLASISGGTFNTASGEWSSISGGSGNTASGLISSVSGGAMDLSMWATWLAATSHRSAAGRATWQLESSPLSVAGSIGRLLDSSTGSPAPSSPTSRRWARPRCGTFQSTTTGGDTHGSYRPLAGPDRHIGAANLTVAAPVLPTALGELTARTRRAISSQTARTDWAT